MARAKSNAMHIGRKLAPSNAFLKDAPSKMISPEQVKEMFKDDKLKTEMLKNATFGFKGGEDVKSLSASKYKLITFEECGIYLAGDGSVRYINGKK
ncbi:MAG: hypothetical protein HRT88_04140 [Lentisphaeraceae bacterium]|nr:hypothetical protein [Lentisphaeraceae bacterium]